VRFKVKLQSDTGVHEMSLDLSHVNMTKEQEPIVQKLLKSVENEPIEVRGENPCTVGECLASKYLTPDEFSKIRDLRISLGTKVAHPNLACDFCLNCIK
jgi:hypothetical protein